MFSFLGYPKKHDANSLSYKLFKIMGFDEKASKPDLEAASEFIRKNSDGSFDFYLKKKNYGIEYSIIQLSLVHANLNLVDAILTHPSMMNQKTHDWDTVFKCLEYSLVHPLMLFKLVEFYKHRIPEVKYVAVIKSIPSDSPLDSFHNYFSDFPAEEIWRLFIDGTKQKKENGWLDYERREKGCMMGMMNGLSHVKDHINDVLTVKLLLDLHAACSTNVMNLNKSNPGTFRHNDSAGFPFLYNGNMSINGVIELLEREFKENLTYNVSQQKSPGNQLQLFAKAQPSNEIYQNAEQIIRIYHQSISICVNDVDKINAIIDLITSLERLHPFNDANCRTICIFLLNRELIFNGLSPVILDDPNRFDGFSKSELFNEINKGMLRFNQVKQGNIKDLGIATDKIQIKIKQESKYATCSDTLKHLQIKSVELLDGMSMLRNTKKN